MEEIFLLDPASKLKAGAGEGSRRGRTTNNMTTGVQYSLRRLGLSIRIFGDGSRIGMVIRSDHREGSEAMAEAQAAILTILIILILPLVEIFSP